MFRPNRDAQVRLFCFPYAGGGASVFARWHRNLPGYAEVIALQLPGRESCFREPPITDMETALAECMRVIEGRLDKPFVFFGHSLGGLLAFEVARTLHRRGLPLPQTLYVSGVRAPAMPARRAPIYHLGDTAFIDEIRKYNGTPESVLQNQELLPLILPVLRADTTLFDRYQYRKEHRLPCPIVAFGGDGDPHVNLEELRGWEAETVVPLRCRIFEGDHFFIHEHEKELQREISVGMARVLEQHYVSRYAS